LPRPAQGTCNWILKDPLYTSWMRSEETGVLWVTGEPGCGKTMLSLYLTEHLEFDSARPTHSQVFYFFCDDKITTQRDAKDIMRSILHQILQQHRKLIKFARSRWETTGQSLVESFTALWEIFLNIISEARIGVMGVIVDAIDECEANSRWMFLRFVQKLVDDSRTLVPRPRSCVKFLITSRPSIKEFATFSSLKGTLQIDNDSSRVSDDIKLVIQDRFSHIASKAGFSDETRAELEDLLHIKADRSFLWLNLILQRLEDTPSTSRKDFKRIIHGFPHKLEETYEKFIHGIPHDNRNDGREILCLLIGSSRHLTLEEMDIAYTIRRDAYKNLASVKEDQQHAMGKMLQNVVGSFIRIEASEISLIHQSVKDFLSDFAAHSPDEAVRSFGVSQATAALAMATCCIRYLLLDDFAENIFIMKYPDFETERTEI
jgi:ankyrin repeat domain-containing protein 50